MKNFFIVEENCNGCGKCLKACSCNAIEMVNQKAKLDLNSCNLCKACIEACKQKAIVFMDTKDKLTFENKGVWVFIEYFNDRINPACFQILSKGNSIAKTKGDALTSVVVAKKFNNLVRIKKELAKYGTNNVILFQSDSINYSYPEDIANIISQEILTKKPDILLFLGTCFGRSLAPRVATKINAGLTADCTDLFLDKDNNLIQVRPTYGGKILASIICPRSRPQIATVRPNIFEAIKVKTKLNNVKLFVKNVEVDSIENRKFLLKDVINPKIDVPLEEAEVVVCGGLGVGSKQGFKLLEKLANKLGGVLACTRAVVDKGWVDFSRQVGQTGKIIRPKLYIGIGVSGAIHHIMGMRRSKRIIAINKDPRAPIFKIADLCMVGDLFAVVPKLTEYI